ncbi:Nitrogen permease regulator 2 [Geranomyces variabilis]|nr:Nitrogen permease regulator 2 [Geranomyces variabilis]
MFARRWKTLVEELTSTYDIPSHARLDTAGESNDGTGKSKSDDLPPAASSESGLDSNASKSEGRPASSNPLTKSTREVDDLEAGLGGADNEAEEEEEEEEVSFSDLGALGDGTQVLKKFMNPLTFQFRKAKREEHYFRTHLLPNRVLHMRLLAFLQLVQYSVIMYPTYASLSNSAYSELFDPAYDSVWAITTVLWLFLLIITRPDIYLAVFEVETVETFDDGWRGALIVEEVALIAVALAASWDFFLPAWPSQAVGPLSTTAILYFAISSGFASTYRQGVVGIVFVLAACVGKLIYIATSWHSWHDCVVYTVPIIMTLIIAQGLVFAGDRNRRISYIKYQVVEDRLAQMKLERMKTDYLLSLSLPKTIVTTLREVGATNFDLIAKRIPNATVMFGDLKNFKEVASTLGSTKEALTLLNGIFQYMDEVIEEYEDLTKIKTISTKILFVGGLQGTKTHPLQMIDMAVQMRDYFRSTQTYTIGDQEVPIKLNIEFGVATGPLVAGIVGRKKFVYEIYGDVVNTSSRMCSLAHEDQIIITEPVHEHVREGFQTISMGTREVKGKGTVPIYCVEDAVDDGTASFEQRFKKRNSVFSSGAGEDTSATNMPARLLPPVLGGRGPAEHIAVAARRQSMMYNQSATQLERVRSIPAISSKRLDQYVSVAALSGMQIDGKAAGANPPTAQSQLDKYLSGSALFPGTGGMMDTKQPAKQAMDVAKMGSPLTLQRTARTGLTHVDREWENQGGPSRPRVTFNAPTGAVVPEGEEGEDDGTFIRPAVDYGRRKSVRNVLVADTVEDPDAKEVLLDVVKRMAAKVDISAATGLSYMRVVNSEIAPFPVRFKHSTIERCYRGDLTADTEGSFVRAGAIALFSEMLLYFLAIYNVLEFDIGLVDEPSAYYLCLISGIASVGVQLLVTGVTVFAAGDDQPPSRDIWPRQLMFAVIVWTFFIACLCTTLPWSLLYRYPFLTGCVIPHLAFFFLMRIEGIIFTYRLVASTLVGAALTIVQQVLHNAIWQEATIVLLSGCIWIVVFYLLEKRNRVDYLIDLILETQAELVTEEIEKSAGVLHSILPQAVIFKLLEDPLTIAYEEMDMVTVLHMDIAGFTSMSSNLEPLTIVKVLNTLFTFFDHLTEEYGVEKITTIGDAYVACSSLSESADAKIGALSICLVALQMQAYLETQLNMSPIVLQVIKHPLKMRIGLHTGPAHGAIMGGPKNFRYDVMGDTVLNAEKTQERCPIGEVSITNVTYHHVREYHGFSFIPENHPGLPTSLKAYTLKAADERIVQAATEPDHDPSSSSSPAAPAPVPPILSRTRSASVNRRPMTGSVTAAAGRKITADANAGGPHQQQQQQHHHPPPPSPLQQQGSGRGASGFLGAATTGRKATTLAKIHPTAEDD